MPESISLRYQTVLERTRKAAQRAGRDPNRISIIAVSKGQPASAIKELYKLGHRDFGENYAQELQAKAGLLRDWGCSEIRWHFIGHLQSNKVKALIPHLSYVHTVDSVVLAQAISRRWKEPPRSGSLDIFIEIKLGDESSKTGVVPMDLPALVDAIHQKAELRLRGLMTVPPLNQDPRPYFRKLRSLGRQATGGEPCHLSMGMSGDFETAIEEGATHLRIGTLIFGERKP